MGEGIAALSHGQYVTVKWNDVVNPPKEETRTPEEVIDRVLGRLKEVSAGERI